MLSFKKKNVIVYSCSGCSNLAQMANSIAVTLHREGVAQMSCISGVGAGVTSLVKTAQNGEHIIALDGCELECAKKCLLNIGVEADEHIIFTQQGFKKNNNESCAEEIIKENYELIKQRILKVNTRNE